MINLDRAGEVMNHKSISGAVIAAVLLPAMVQVGAAQNSAALDHVVQDAMRPLLGTAYVEARPGFADGKLENCIIEFSVLAQDWAYKQGAYIRVGGSFGVFSAKGKMAATLKVI